MRFVEIDPGEVRLQHGPRPDLRPGWARVRVQACAVCGTDVHMVQGMVLPAGVSYPIRPGHEVAGIVVEVASDPSPVAPGTPVVLHPLAPCGQCEACTAGQEQRCPMARILGIHEPGGLADEVVWPADRLVDVTGISPVFAALLPDAVATAWHAYQAADVPPGGTLAVLGAGGVGTNLLQLARIANPTARLLAVVRTEHTAERIRALDVDTVVGLDGAARTVREALGELDAVVDFTGVPAAPAEGIRMLRRGGHLVIGSVVDEPIELGVTTTSLVTREVRIVGSYVSTIEDLRAVARLVIQSRLDLKDSVSLIMPLDEAPEGFRLVEQRPAGHVRLVFEM